MTTLNTTEVFQCSTGAMVFEIMGPTRRHIREFCASIDVTAQVLYVEHIPADEFRQAVHVYQRVADLTEKRREAVSRSVERLAKFCWDDECKGRLVKFIGREFTCAQSPRHTLIYLACYSHFRQPFFKMVEQHPELMF